MQELINEYNISKSFYKRYLEENAKQRLGMEMLKFLYFKEGKFINPMKKSEILEKYIHEEIDNFYKKNQVNIPQIEFCITTKCTLKCKDCCALIPKFSHNNHVDMTFKDFKKYLDNLLDAVNSIRHFVILGGEPLINRDLGKIIDYACKQDKIFIVQLITNGTINFSDELLEILKRNNKKVYVYISNYSSNEKLKPILKHEHIKESLKNYNIKLQMAEDKFWLTEKCFAKVPSDKKSTAEKILNCTRTQCNQVIAGNLDICSKAATARMLNLLDIDDAVDLTNNENLKQKLTDFYQCDFFKACSQCILSDENVQPALQEYNGAENE